MKRLFSRFSSRSPTEDVRSSVSPPNQKRDASPSVRLQKEQELWHAGALIASSSVHSPAAAGASGWSKSVEFASDPNAWEQEFLVYWRRLKAYLARPDAHEVFTEVRELLTQVSNLLVVELNSQPEAVIGPVLDHFFNDEIFRSVLEWAQGMPTFLVPVCQVMLLQNFEDIITRSQPQQHCLLVHKPILTPLLRLLQWCRRSADERRVRLQLSNVDKYFVQLLNQICMKMAEDATLLHFFFVPRNGDPSRPATADEQEGDENAEQEQPFLVFSLLIPYLYSAGDIGQMARDALYLIMTVSSGIDLAANHIAGNSNFCPVLAAGLSGCFSELPRDVCAAIGCDLDDFHKLHVPADVGLVKELSDFYQALLFCNGVVQVAHREVVRQIIRYFYNGFLLEVVASALQSGVDMLESIIVYLHLCFDTVTEPPLIQSLVKLLIVAETNTKGANLLEIILAKMNSNERLCRVTLSLLRTLVDLRCEDLMWAALLRFILPNIHLKRAGRRFDINISLDAASAFLDCIPDCTQGVNELNSEATFDAYLAEASHLVRATEQDCKCWAYRYDGIKPNSLLNLNVAEEMLSARQPFARLSSARSSYASMQSWPNRYFVRQNRSAHATQESVVTTNDATTADLLPLNELGELTDAVVPLTTAAGVVEPLDLQDESPSGDYITQFEAMADPRFNYHFAYEGVSESDESTSRRNSNSNEDSAEVASTTTTHTHTAGLTSKYATAVLSTDWNAAKTNEAFVNALKSLPKADRIATGDRGGKLPTIDENISLIASRLQYISELKTEREREQKEVGSSLPKLDLHSLKSTNSLPPASEPCRGGIPLACGTDKDRCVLLESIMSTLERVSEFGYGYSTCLQLVGLLISLMSYPQPLLVSFLLYVDSAKSCQMPKITRALRDLKQKVDTTATSTEGFDDLLAKALCYTVSKAERAERAREGGVPGRQFGDRNGGVAGRNTFKFTHVAVESPGRESDGVRAKNCAYTAILLSQLSQMAAAFSLQHTALVEYINDGAFGK